MDHDGGEARNESLHPVRIERSSIAELAGGPRVRVNSSHHQAVRTPGRGLRVVARATDGVIEAIEWTGPGWVMGVQWHPERMPDDPFASALFRRLVEEAQSTTKTTKRYTRRAARHTRRSR
jgi:putative glutamine amidotransferase